MRVGSEKGSVMLATFKLILRIAFCELEVGGRAF